MTTLKIFNLIEGKGLNRKFKIKKGKNEKLDGEENYLELGLIVYDDQGQSVKDATVEIVATDAEQNRTLNSTGNIRKIIGEDGNKKVVHYYPFHYEFNTAGKHEITFSVGKLSEKVNIDVNAE